MDQRTGFFNEFLEWQIKGRVARTLSGNALTRLHNSWDLWLICQSHERQIEIINSFESVSSDPEGQLAFLMWLGAQEGFGEIGQHLACYQLVQCKGFETWSELQRSVRIGGLQEGVVSGFFLLNGREEEAGIVKNLIASVGPQPTNEERGGTVQPLNFTVTMEDENTWRALDGAMGAARQILSVRGVLFWCGYIIGGDFICVSAFKFLFSFPLLIRARKILLQRDVFLRVQSSGSISVAGQSLGLAASVATLLAAVRHVEGSCRFKLVSHLGRIKFEGLQGAAFTGTMHQGKIGPVGGIKRKLASLENSSSITRAIIPRENEAEVKTDIGSLFPSFQTAARIEACSSFVKALWKIVPVRKTWLIINLLFLVAIIWTAIRFPQWLHRHYLRNIAISSIETTTDSLGISDLQNGLEVGNPERITVNVVGHFGDGPIDLLVRCDGPKTEGVGRQCLRTTGETSGDWASHERIRVKGTSASFDIKQSPGEGRTCAALALSLEHREAIVDSVRIRLQPLAGDFNSGSPAQ